MKRLKFLVLSLPFVLAVASCSHDGFSDLSETDIEGSDSHQMSVTFNIPSTYSNEEYRNIPTPAKMDGGVTVYIFDESGERFIDKVTVEWKEEETTKVCTLPSSLNPDVYNYQLLAVGMNSYAAKRFDIIPKDEEVNNIDDLRAEYGKTDYTAGDIFDSQIFAGTLLYPKDGYALTMSRRMAGIACFIDSSSLPDGTTQLRMLLPSAQNAAVKLKKPESDSEDDFGSNPLTNEEGANVLFTWDCYVDGVKEDGISLEDQQTPYAYVLPYNNATENATLTLQALNEGGEVINEYKVVWLQDINSSDDTRDDTSNFSLYANQLYLLGTPDNPCELPEDEDGYMNLIIVDWETAQEEILDYDDFVTIN